jgi:O-succinylbenzoic acid--CoA ligase
MLALDQPVDEAGAAAVVATSGSTGRPKGVVLSREAITTAVAATHARLGGPGDWVLAVPAHYVAGLMVLARTVLAGTTAHEVPSDLRGLDRAVAAMTGRRYLSLVPTQLVRACADPRLTEALAGFDAVLLGGAAADPQLLALARERGIAVVPTYGMSETCGGCVYDGVPLDGVRVDLEPGTERILLAGAPLFSGYRLRPDLTAAALRAGRLLTQDRGRWRDGRLDVLGRLDDVVVSGGVNVDLAAVERASRGWPGVTAAELAVVGVPDPEWGTRVVAVTDGYGTLDDLRQFLRLHLPAAAAPRQLVRVAALPRLSSGKIDRQRLVELVSGSSADGQKADR